MASITSVSTESRRFEPRAEFRAHANVSDPDVWEMAGADPQVFWAEQAERLQWEQPWHTVLDWKPVTALSHPDGSSQLTEDDEVRLAAPRIRWFEGGKLNVAVNCVDRHVNAGLGERVAIHFEGEPGDRETITYRQLQDRVNQTANLLESLGVNAGDRVVLYLPVIPETVIITLAIARIGAIHSLVFGGFSAEALRVRIEDTGAKLLVTTDGQFRRGQAVAVKAEADAALCGEHQVEHVLVVRRTATPSVPWTPGRDLWYQDELAAHPVAHEAVAFDSEHPLFIIYTSGTTGKPKGVVHTSGGYLTQASYSHWAHFDVKPQTDVYWCTADLAWVTAHTYSLYGPFSNATTSVLYEGTPNSPSPSRHFEIIERYGVTQYYTAPTLIRSLMTWFPDGPPADWSLERLRLLGTVGEAINPEAWAWFHQHLGRGECPVVDTWWQSESGAAIVAPLPGLTTTKPGSATRAVPGLRVRVVDADGEDAREGVGGFIVIDGPWPAMARGLWNAPDRWVDSYWRQFWRQGFFAAGDGARFDADGDVWLLGRIDDVINVSGHRLSTIEIESALVSSPLVGEAGVVGVTDALTGQAIAAFVVPAGSTTGDDVAAFVERTRELTGRLRAHVAREIGPIAKPAHIFVVPEVPKTRSGKILRRLLAQLAEQTALGDTTSLQNAPVVPVIAEIIRRQTRQSEPG